MNDWTVFAPAEFSKIREFDKQQKGYYLGFVYIFECGKFTKIGMSKKPYQRLRALKHNAEGYGNQKTGRIAISKIHTNYKENEKRLHQFFSKFRKEDTELFELQFDEVCEMLPQLFFEDNSKDLESQSQKKFESLVSLLFGGSS